MKKGVLHPTLNLQYNPSTEKNIHHLIPSLVCPQKKTQQLQNRFYHKLQEVCPQKGGCRSRGVNPSSWYGSKHKQWCVVGSRQRKGRHQRPYSRTERHREILRCRNLLIAALCGMLCGRQAGIATFRPTSQCVSLQSHTTPSTPYQTSPTSRTNPTTPHHTDITTHPNTTPKPAPTSSCVLRGYPPHRALQPSQGQKPAIHIVC